MRSITLFTIFQAGQLALAAPALFSGSTVQKRHMETVETFEADFYRHMEERNADDSHAVETCLRFILPDPKFHHSPRTPSIVEIIPCPPKKADSDDHSSIDDVCAARAATEAARRRGGSGAAAAVSSVLDGGDINPAVATVASSSGATSGGPISEGDGVNNRPSSNSPNGNNHLGPTDSTNHATPPTPGNDVDEDPTFHAGTVHAVPVKAAGAKPKSAANSCSTGTPAEIAVCIEASVNSPLGRITAGTRHAITLGGSSDNSQPSADECSVGTPAQVAACIDASVDLSRVIPMSTTSSSATSTQSTNSPTSTTVDCKITENANLAVCLKAVAGQ